MSILPSLGVKSLPMNHDELFFSCMYVFVSSRFVVCFYLKMFIFNLLLIFYYVFSVRTINFYCIDGIKKCFAIHIFHFFCLFPYFSLISLIFVWKFLLCVLRWYQFNYIHSLFALKSTLFNDNTKIKPKKRKKTNS